MPHNAYRDMSADDIAALATEQATIADIKGMWRDRELPDGLDFWTL